MLLWRSSRLNGGEVGTLIDGGTEVAADVPELLLAQSAVEVQTAIHAPVTVNVLRPRGADARHGVIGVGRCDGVVGNIGAKRDSDVLVDAVVAG